MYLDISGNYPIPINLHFTGASDKIIRKSKTYLLIESDIASFFIGNIKYTKTITNSHPTGLYSFINIGNKYNSQGYGINLWNWYSFEIYYSCNIGIGISGQITPWITYGNEISILEGISIAYGLNIGNINHTLSFSIGSGAVVAYALAGIISLTPIPGARVVAATIVIVTTNCCCSKQYFEVVFQFQ